MKIWDHLDHFTINENCGEPDKINGLLLITLDRLRKYVGFPFSINFAYELSGHVSKSQHYLGNAVDFYIKGIDFISAYERLLEGLYVYQIADRVGFGVYPDWLRPGFHLDVRGQKARWGRIGQDYVSIDKAIEHFKNKSK